jgi:hypothetical protein
VKLPSISEVHAAVLAPVERPRGGGRTLYQRFAIPHSFKPDLSFGEAVIASLATFLRIFLGSILFGVYGWNALVKWTAIRSMFWKVVAVPPIVLGFLVLLAALMLAISALTRKLLPR